MKNNNAGVRSIFRNAAFLSCANFYYIFLRAIYIVLLARILGPELYGAYSYSQNWYVTLLPLAIWGSGELLMQELGVAKKEGLQNYVGTSLSLRLILGIIFFAILNGSAFIFESDGHLVTLIFIFSQGIVVRGLIDWCRALIVGSEKAKYYTFLTAPFITLEVILGLYLATSGIELIWIAVAQTTIWWLQLAVTYIVCHKKVYHLQWRFSIVIARSLIKKGGILATSSFLLSWLGPGALILYRYFADSAEQIGQAAFVLQAYMIAGGLIGVTFTTALPVLSRSAERNDSKDALFAWFIFTQALFLGAGLWIVGKEVIGLLVTTMLGEQYQTTGAIFAGALWLLIPITISYGFTKVLITANQLWGLLVSNLMGAATLLFLLFFLTSDTALTPQHMMNSLGISFSISAGTMSIFLYLEGKLLANLGYTRSILFFLVAVLIYEFFGESHFAIAVPLALLSLAVGYALCIAKLKGALSSPLPK